MFKNTFLLTIFALVSVFVMNSCKKNIDDESVPKALTMDDLVVASSFDWSTTREVTIHVTMPSTVNYNDYRSRITISTAPEELGGVILNAGSVNAAGTYDATVVVPADLDSLFVLSHVGSVWIAITAAKSTGMALDGNINFGYGFGELPPEDTIVMKSVKTGGISKGVRATAQLLSQNLIQNGNFDVNSFGTFPDWPSPMVADGKWYFTSTLAGAVSRYSDAGNNVLRVNVPASTSYRSGGVAQLITANPGELITFSTDFKLMGSTNSNNNAWLYIIPRNAAGTSLAYYNYNIYPIASNSPWTRYTVAATMPAGTVKVQILLWHWVFSGSFIWDNVIVTGPTPDGDGDGVPDDQDEYASDATRAYNIYYPGKGIFGSLAYEDNWPGKGDYDCNDLVVDYNYKQVTNSANALVELFPTFILRAAGASFVNGFGFQMGMTPADVSNVTGTSVLPGYITLMANNTEANQNKATVIVTDNVFRQLPQPGGGTGTNTTPGLAYVTPDTMKLKVSFTRTIPITLSGTPPYNPFLIVNQIRGREVHLPDQPPTALADVTLFGTGNDDSKPASGRYYKSLTNLPWAMNFPVKFDYPVERAPIIDAYLHFADWAQSSGALYPSWYTTASGNRNAALIYQKPVN
jgi:LruC domain-containing protein